MGGGGSNPFATRLIRTVFPLSKVNETHRLVAASKIQGNLALLPWA